MPHDLLGTTFRRSVLAPVVLALMLAGCDSIEERIADHYERGQELIDSSEPEKAILEFRNALELDPDHAPSHYAIGLIQEEKGDLQPAFRRFKKVAEIDPSHVDARLKLARYYMVGDALEDARGQMDVVLRIDPNRADVQAVHAFLSLREGNPEETRKALDLGLTLDPQNAELALFETAYLMQTASSAAALARIDQALAAHPAHLPLHAAKLQILQSMGDEEGISAQLTAMIEIFPEEIGFRQARAQLAAKAGDFETAEADLRAIVRAQPGDTEAVANLVRLLRQQDGDDAAREALAALAAEPGASLDLELLLARFDIETGDTESAIAHLRELAGREGPDANRARVALANLLQARGEAEEAAALVERVLTEDPTDVDALVLRIARLIEDKNLDEAIQTVRKGLNEAPEDVRLLLLAGRAHELSGSLDIANDRLAKAVRVDGYKPDAVQRYVEFLLRADRITAAETVLSEAVARNPAEVRLHDLLGFIRVRLKDWAGAERELAALDRLDPERARQLRAAILIGQERFDEGVGLLRDLPRDAGRRAASIAAIVQSYVRDGKTTEAEAFLDGLLSENPENIQAIGLRGNLHAASGDLAAAEENYRKILDIDPGHGGAHSALARVYALGGDEKASEAQLISGLEASPDDLILLGRLAALRESQGQFNEAIAVYDRLYQLLPNSLIVANNLASLLSDHRADQPAEIERAYRIAGRLRDLDIPQYRDTYGWTRYLKGDFEEALKAIAPVADALPDNPWVLYHLGMVQHSLGKPVEARKSLERALEKSAGKEFPPDSEIRKVLGTLEGQ